MKIYALLDGNFYTEEHNFNNYVYFNTTIEGVIAYTKEHYGIDITFDEPVVYSEDEDDEYGERFYSIEEVKVNE